MVRSSPKAPSSKVSPRKSIGSSSPKTTKIRQSARGKDCQVRIAGVCTFDPEKTIWSHYRGSAGGKGMAIKSLDLCGAYACTACDAVYDGQIKRPAGMTKEEVEVDWLNGHIRSLAILAQDGLLEVT